MASFEPPPLGGLDLNLLLALRWLLREKSVSRAAKRVGISQPSMSRALARLRQTFNDPLLVRAGRGMETTAHGAALLEPLEGILGSVGRLEQLGAFEPTRDRRKFTLVIPDIIAALVVPELLRRWRNAHGLTLQVMGNEDSAEARLLSGEADLALGAVAHTSAELVQRKFSPEVGWRVLFGPKHPAWRAGELSAQAWLASEHLQVVPSAAPHAPSDLERVLHARGEKRRLRVFFSDLALVGASLETSALVTSLPAPTAQVVAKGRRLRVLQHPLSGELPPLRLTMAWHRGQQSASAHRWLRQEVAQALGSSFACP